LWDGHYAALLFCASICAEVAWQTSNIALTQIEKPPLCIFKSIELCHHFISHATRIAFHDFVLSSRWIQMVVQI
jgi:hypothetical protein